MEDTAGVVGLKQAIAAENSYAVGAIQDGKGEITLLNGKVYVTIQDWKKTSKKTKKVLDRVFHQKQHFH